MMDIETTAHKALAKFGRTSQRVKTIEELGELIQAISKDLLYTESTPDGVIVYGHRIWHMVMDEIADCFIMLHQMRVLYGSSDVDQRIQFKLESLSKKLDSSTRE